MGSLSSVLRNGEKKEKEEKVQKVATSASNIWVKKMELLIETASILGLEPPVESTFKNENIIKPFDLIQGEYQQTHLLDENKKYQKMMVVTTYSIATYYQMYSCFFSYPHTPLKLRNPNIYSSLNKSPISCISNVLLNNKEGLKIEINNDFQLSIPDAIKYYSPNKNSYKFSFRDMQSMSFKTSNYLTFNGLSFYPVEILNSNEQGKEIIRFKSDGLVVMKKNEKLISQLNEALKKNAEDIDKIYNGNGSYSNSEDNDDNTDDITTSLAKQEQEPDVLEGGALLGERIIIKRQLKIELEKKEEKDIFLTIDIPVGWSCVADCYWTNVSIIRYP